MAGWLIRPGWPAWRSSVLGEFIRKDYISIGGDWDIGDIREMDEDTMRRRLEERKRRGELGSTVAFAMNMLRTIRDEMSIGDIVIVGDGMYIYGVGLITSDLRYERSPPLFRDDVHSPHEPAYYPYKRDVRWIKIMKVRIDGLKVSDELKRWLGVAPAPTIRQLPEERLRELLIALLAAA